MIAKELIRNIQLYKLGLGDLNINEKRIYKHLKVNVSELSCFEDDDNPGCLFFGDTPNHTIIMYNVVTKELNILFDNVCDYLINIMDMEITESKILVESWLKLTLDMNPKSIYYLI